MKNVILSLCLVFHVSFAEDAGATGHALELRLFQARKELVAAIARDGIGSIKPEPHPRGWLLLPKGAADYFRDKGLEIHGGATPSGEAASVMLHGDLELDEKGQFELGPFAESKELRKVFESTEVRKRLRGAKKCRFLIEYGYVGDWNDRPLVHFASFMVRFYPLSKPDLMLYMCSGLEPVQENGADIGQAAGTIALRFPKNSALEKWPKLHSAKTGAVIPNFRIYQE